MKPNEILKNFEENKAYIEFYDFFQDMSKVSDMKYFFEVMESKEEKDKNQIAKGVIYLSSKQRIFASDIAFLNKYHEYLRMLLEKDIREYYNNKYCCYLYTNQWENLTDIKQSNEVKFFNGMSLKQIDDMLVSKHNEIMLKFRNGEELSHKDRNFLEEEFLSLAYSSGICKEAEGEQDVMYDIVDYFSKYPVNDLSTYRDKQLHILSVLSNRMIKIPGNCIIEFDSNIVIDKNNKKILGCFFQENDIPCIRINCLDFYELRTDIKFLDKMFTVFHELGHFKQDVEFNNFKDAVKKIILMEKDMVVTHGCFYNKHHDDFLIERDADNYALIEIIKEYGKKYPNIINYIVSREKKKKRMDFSEFYLMELDEYNNNLSEEQNKKNSL